MCLFEMRIYQQTENKLDLWCNDITFDTRPKSSVLDSHGVHLNILLLGFISSAIMHIPSANIIAW